MVTMVAVVGQVLQATMAGSSPSDRSLNSRLDSGLKVSSL